MREDFEEKGFNPLKLGLIGALIVAGIIAVLLQFGASSSRDEDGIETKSETLPVAQLQKFQLENKELKEKVAELEEVNKVTGDSLEKQLKQKEVQLSSLKRELSSTDKDADAKLGWLRKEKLQLEAQLAQLKKEAESKSNEAKESQQILADLQKELRNARFEVERQQRNNKVLQEKLSRINDGDEAAADVMVRQLAESRQELKRERARREQLEEQLDTLRRQMGVEPQPQQQQ